MRKIIFIAIVLFMSVATRAQVVTAAQPYRFLKWITVADSVRGAIFLQAGDTLATQAYARGFAGAGVGYGIKRVGGNLTFDSASVRKTDSLYAINDTTIGFKINGVVHSFIIRGRYSPGTPCTDCLLASNNLSDITNSTTARTNLGLGTAATIDYPATGNANAGQAVLGNDTRLLGGTPPGNDQDVIFNDGGVYGADDNLTYSKAFRDFCVGCNIGIGDAFYDGGGFVHGTVWLRSQNGPVTIQGDTATVKSTAGSTSMVRIITNNQERWKMDNNGDLFLPSLSAVTNDTSANKIQVFNTSTKKVGYMNWLSGGGGGGGMTNPMTAAGDFIYGASGGAPLRLPAGTNHQLLHSGSTPGWGPIDVTTEITGRIDSNNLSLTGIVDGNYGDGQHIPSIQTARDGRIYGIGAVTNTPIWSNIISKPTFFDDTTVYSTRAWRDKLKDSLGLIILAQSTRITDSSANKIRSVFRKAGTDSVFGVTNSGVVFQFRDSIGTGGGGSTNLDTSRTSTQVSILSSTGTAAVIKSADGAKAGVMSAADKLNLDSKPKIYNVLNFGAIPDGKRLVDGAMSSGTHIFTSATAGFTSGDVGKAIRVHKVGSGGHDLVTTISSVTNSTTVVLSGAVASASVTADTVFYGTDNTAAIQTAINTAYANHGDGDVYAPQGNYIISGALQTSVGGANPNAQICWPVSNLGDASFNARTYLVVRGVGPANPTNVSNSSDSLVPLTGTCFISLIDGTGTIPAVFGTKAPTAGFGNINYTAIEFKDFIIYVDANKYNGGPTMTGINGLYSSTNGINDVAVSINCAIHSVPSVQTNEAAGVIVGQENSEMYTSLKNVWTFGFRYAIIASENVTLDHVMGHDCHFGLVLARSIYPVTGSAVIMHWCNMPLYVPSSDLFGGAIPYGATIFNIQNFEAEVYSGTTCGAPSWQIYNQIITDTADFGNGELHYSIGHACVGIDNSLFNKVGGENIRCYVNGSEINNNFTNFTAKLQANKIGVGVATPLRQLHVFASAADALAATAGILIENQSPNFYATSEHRNDVGHKLQSFMFGSTFAGAGGPYIVDGAMLYANGAGGTTLVNENAGNFSIWTGTTAAERIRLTSAGKMYFITRPDSTGSPTGGNLYVNSDGKVVLGPAGGGSSQWNNVTGGINYPGGLVGINKATPAAQLDVLATSADALNSTGGISIENQNSSFYAKIGLKNDAGKVSTRYLLGSSYGTPDAFKTNYLVDYNTALGHNFINADASAAFKWYTRGTNDNNLKMTLDPNGDLTLDSGKVMVPGGKVWIGTISGNAPFQINTPSVASYGQFTIKDRVNSGDLALVYKSIYDAADTRLYVEGFGHYGGTHDAAYYYANEQNNSFIWRNGSSQLAELTTAGEFHIGSVTDQGSFTLQNTGGFYQSGAVKINLGSDATGDIYYRNSGGNLTRLAIGGAQQHLLGGTIPHWGDTATGGGGGIDSTTADRIARRAIHDSIGRPLTIANAGSTGVSLAYIKGIDTIAVGKLVGQNGGNSTEKLTDSSVLILSPIREIGDYYDDFANSSTTETNGYGYDIDQSIQPYVDGDKFFFTIQGTFVGSATATRTVRAYFGGTQIFTSGGLTNASSNGWEIRGWIIRVGSTTARCSVSFSEGGLSTSLGNSYTEVTGLNFSSPVSFLTTLQAGGTGAATNDIVEKMANFEWKRALTIHP